MIIVEDRQSQFGTVTIYRRRSTGTVIYDQLGCSQSEADGNGISLAPYVHAIYGLILQMRAKDVLMIGCGGGTLGTMLAVAGCGVTIVDINPDAFTLARRHFGLPHQIACHVSDGSVYLSNETRQFDAVVLDAYHGDAIPDHLRTPAFFQRARLAVRGVLFSNAHVRDDNDGTADAMAQAMAEAFDHVRILDAPGWYNRNAIVVAGDVLDLTPPALRVIPSEQSDQIAFELETMRFRPWNAT